VCYVPSFKLISEWVNPNLTSLVDLNKRLGEKENDEFCRYHSMREVEMMRMMTIEGMTRNSLQP
jgi:hypothetical protein